MTLQPFRGNSEQTRFPIISLTERTKVERDILGLIAARLAKNRGLRLACPHVRHRHDHIMPLFRPTSQNQFVQAAGRRARQAIEKPQPAYCAWGVFGFLSERPRHSPGAEEHAARAHRP